MHHDIFEALVRLFCQFCVEANRPSAMIAASPLGLHLLHIEPLYRYAQNRDHLAITAGTAAFNWLRYHWATMSCFFSSVVFGGTRSNSLLCWTSIVGTSCPQSHAADSAFPKGNGFPRSRYSRGVSRSCPTIFLCCCFIQPSFEIANTRTVSRLIRIGAEMRTRPAGG